MKISQHFNKPKIVGVCGDVNTGKSMLLYSFLDELRSSYSFNLYTYGLRLQYDNAVEVYSVAELESIRDSFIVIDELSSLFDLDNRKIRKQIENTLRLINHNNNILVLCGTPENFKKFISAKLDMIFYKKCTLADFINGSTIKNSLTNYKGNERGTEVLTLLVNEVILYNGTHYEKYDVPYVAEYDSKKDNQPIFQKKQIVPKNVPENVPKDVPNFVVKEVQL